MKKNKKKVSPRPERKQKLEVVGTENIYEHAQCLEQMQEDEISPQEAGFMEGYEHPKQTSREIEKNLRKKKK